MPALIAAWTPTWIWCSRRWPTRTRRQLLDRLHARDGQTLGELCGSLAMARQSASQHLAVLEAANLISTTRRGREKVHHLNPVPLHDMQERWIDKYERPRLRTLSDIRRSAEEQAMSEIPDYVYVTYIRASPEQVWHALTDADLHGPLLGAPQRVGLAAGLDVAARPHRRVRHRRRRRHGGREPAARARWS